MLGKIVNKFRIEAVLGEGGMGVVYRARDMVLERQVALKMIHREYTPNEISFQRFWVEARILARLEHPNIVQVHDLLEHEGTWFIVMQFVEGLTLAQVIEREGPLPYQRVSTICKQILSALGYAHRAGVIHRDIKPGNVILTLEGAVKVADFGLAKYERSPALTQSSSVAGTPYYMSPEQVKNLANVDHRSDLYAIGMTLYEMLTGRTPFPPGSAPIDIMNAILEEQFPSPSRIFTSVPKPLGEIVMKALAKNPSKRYQTADEMLKAIVLLEHRAAHDKTVKLSTEDVFDVFGHGLRHGPLSDAPTAKNDGGRESISAMAGPSAAWPRAGRSWGFAGKSKRLVFGLSSVVAAIVLTLLTLRIWPGSRDAPPGGLAHPAPLLEARMSILTEPANATVFLNGDSIGMTPIQDFSVTPGSLALRIQKQNYSPIVTVTTVTASRDTTISFRLEAINTDARQTLAAAGDSLKQTLPQSRATPPTLGEVRIDSKPSGAAIVFDGKLRGKTPQTITNVAVGEHGIVLKKTDYREASLSITIAGGESENIDATLVPLKGRLRVLVKPSGAVYIEGVQERPNVSVPYETSLPVGSYRIKAVGPEHDFLEKTISIQADRLQEWTVDFSKMVTLIVTAFNSAGQRVLGEVFVDGKHVGQTLQELRVRVGEHKIEVRREGYRLAGDPQNLTLEENIEQPVRMRFTLQKLE
ncbi:MAG: protein kinase domain-containing protein [bacterium]